MKFVEPEVKPYSEITKAHTRLMKCPLALEESRAYWQRAEIGGDLPSGQEAFDQYWFGAKSLSWVKILLRNFQIRYGGFPDSLEVLQSWNNMMPDTRVAICHWHMQLTDPLYRQFTGDYLVARRKSADPELHLSSVVSWVSDNGQGSWTMGTKKKLALKLLSAAHSAGLLSGKRNPRTPVYPKITDEALTYILYLLRFTEYSGSRLDNFYLSSVGLSGSLLEARLRKLPSLKFQRMADVVEFNWQYPTLTAWAQAELPSYGMAT